MIGRRLITGAVVVRVVVVPRDTVNDSGNSSEGPNGFPIRDGSYGRFERTNKPQESNDDR